MKLLNAFSTQMLGADSLVSVRSISLDAVKKMAERGMLESCIGHADTAAVLSAVLGSEITHNRVAIQLQPGDRAVVAQLTGGRLPEGATTLPDDFNFVFRVIDIQGCDAPVDDPKEGSIHGAIMGAAEKIAAPFGADVTPCKDCHGNFVAIVSARGLYARVWDD